MKPFSSFHDDPAGGLRLKSRCRACTSAAGKTKRATPEGRASTAATNRLKNYGITRDQYDTLLVNQHGLCAICNEPETRVHKSVAITLTVDHDHDTNAIRGLLCWACNTALGHFKDSLSTLRLAVAYMESR